MTQRPLVATVQFEPTLGEKDRNIDALCALVAQAAQAGARLVVTPEMGTTGYCWFDRAEVAPHVEPVPGPTTDRFSALARTLGCHIVIGMPEVDPATDLYYNSAVLIGPEGIVGTHRKTHPYIAEPKWSAAGNLGHQVFETPVGRVALLICMDIHFIETARLAALGGADVICHISNWLAERTPAPYWISRAFENGCTVIESNRWGLERGVQFSGGSCIINPDGTLAAVIDAGDGVAVAELAAPGPRHGCAPAFSERRPELYLRLATDTFLWNPTDFFSLYGHRPLPPGRLSRVAVAQMTPGDDIAANVARIRALATEARRREGADLVVFPARALTGLSAPQAVAADDAAIAALAALARREKLWLVVGFAERAADGLYNAAAVIGPDGVAGIARQTHLSATERTWARPADAWAVFDTPAGRLGVLVGQDALFPEAGRVLALEGCDIIAAPAAIAGRFTAAHAGTKVGQNYPIPTGADPFHWHHFRVRGGENNVWFCFANILDPQRGLEGASGVFGPDTFAFPREEAIVEDGEGVAVVPVDTTSLSPRYPTNVVRRKDLVSMRHPHEYGLLIAR